MPNKRIINNLQVDKEDLKYSTWQPVLTDSMSDEGREIFFRRKRAIELYIDNEITVKEICALTNIEESELQRLVKRCFQTDNKGFIWGYRALIPRKRINKYERKNIVKDDNNIYNATTGLFEMILDTYPTIKEKLVSLYFNLNKDSVNDPVIKLRHLHKKFLEACLLAGIPKSEYPFNTQSRGKISLYRFIKKLEGENFFQAAKRNGEDAARHARTTGIGNKNTPVVLRPFENVQFDGHRIDAMISITFKTPEGDEITAVMDRIWILVIIDVATRAIIGHHLSLNKEYSSSDVLQCIKNAIIPKEMMALKIPGLKYPGKGGFISLEVPETEWALWEEFSYDNGKANLANIVRNRLTKIVGCAVNPGPVKMPERRSIIERFFGILEENGYHRLPSTTGSNPNDPRRSKPEQNAVKYKISIEELEELTDVLIANYNHTENSGINYLTPIDCMKQRIGRGMMPRLMDVDKRNEVSFLTLHDQRYIKGDVKKGRRPYIYYEGVEYRNEVLARNSGLIGTKLDLLVNIDDIRSIRAFMPDGTEFGIVTATRRWGVMPHSLRLRKEINRLRNQKQIHFTSIDDPIEIYQKYLQSRAVNNKSDRNKYAELQRKLKKEEILNPENTNYGSAVTAINATAVSFKPDSVKPSSKDIRKVVRTIIY